MTLQDAYVLIDRGGKVAGMLGEAFHYMFHDIAGFAGFSGVMARVTKTLELRPGFHLDTVTVFIADGT